MSAADARFLTVHMQNFKFFLHIDQAENTGYCLRDNSCIGSSGGAGSDLYDEKQIQRNV